MNAIYRDVRYVVPFLINFWMLASPVGYGSSIVPTKWRWLYGLNPMAGVIEGFRWSLRGPWRAPGRLLIASTGVVLVLLCGRHRLLPENGDDSRRCRVEALAGLRYRKHERTRNSR